MVKLFDQGSYLIKDTVLVEDITTLNLDEINHILQQSGKDLITKQQLNPEVARQNTLSYGIFKAHNNSDDMGYLKMKFDSLASHDITYVGIVQTAKASGLDSFPIPYVLTNCHNSLCSVGGTINEDDHVFGLSAAKKYGGIYVPAHQAVIHQYMREMMAGCGKMILGSDSHTRYGALGTMAIGEGGPELVKQLLKRTYDVKYPGIVAVYLEGTPRLGVGPQDVALTIIEKVFNNGFVKNKVMEFVGPGIKNLTVEYRNGIDVMTTETTCLSSIWSTDEQVEDYLALHGRKDAYQKLAPADVAYYDGLIKVDLSTIEPVIALPFHPSNVYTIKELNANPREILQLVEEDAKKIFGNNKINFSLTDKIIDGKIKVDQGIVAGCSGGTYENISLMGEMIAGHSTGSDDFVLSVYPASQPVFYALNKNGSINKLMEAGANIKTAFCGPCFGAGDVPSNNALSIRHATRNFPNREGSKPSDGQISSVALMDARSITATAINGGFLTAATDIDVPVSVAPYVYNSKIYDHRIYQGFHEPHEEVELKFGPNIKEWPTMSSLTDNLLLKVTSVIKDPVTTTDELIPSGETSSYRSNPHRLAEFTLSRKDPAYVGRSKEIYAIEKERMIALENIDKSDHGKLKEIFDIINTEDSFLNLIKTTSIGSIIYANKPGDGSAREQAASCQKVLGGWGNLSLEYATKRYRSNLINWGLLPFITKEENIELTVDDYIYIPGIKGVVENGKEELEAYIIHEGKKRPLMLYLPELSASEREILLAGCLINYYKTN
ncbi:MAG: hydratase [Firmicutes bacterium HGW-Firmicutes-1]|jgi:aconitate hydratase|nr:MAG: hydratase [Firmicutes bacterium HGW-Firmicutes-1]